MEVQGIWGDDILVTPDRGGAFVIDIGVKYIGRSAILQGLLDEDRLALEQADMSALTRYVIADPFEPGQFALLSCRFALTVEGHDEPVTTSHCFREITGAA